MVRPPQSNILATPLLTTKHRPRSSVEENFDFSAYVSIFRRQRGRESKGVVFTATLIARFTFKPHPGLVVASLDKAFYDDYQRWSPRGRPWPRGHNLKSLASKVKSLALASRPQVLENWPVLGSRTALFFGMLKFCGVLEKLFGKRFLVEIA